MESGMWLFVGVAVPTLLGMGWGAMQMTGAHCTEFRIARACFWAACLVPATAVHVSLIANQLMTRTHVVLACASVLIAFPLAALLRWVNERESKCAGTLSRKDSQIWAGIKSAWEEAVSLRQDWQQNNSDPPLQETEEYLKRTLAFAQNNLTLDEIRKLDSPFEQKRNVFDPMRSQFEMVNYLWGRLLDYERHLQEIMQTFTLHPQTEPLHAAPMGETARLARLKISHDIECVVPRTFYPTEGPPIKGLMHHLRAESVLKSRVINCQAVLKRLEKNGETVVSACNLPFKFHPSQLAGSNIKTINHREEQYLELVWLPWERDAEIMVDFEFADLEHKPLDEHAHYSLFIVFTGDNIDGQEVVMDIHHEERGWDVSKR